MLFVTLTVFETSESKAMRTFQTCTILKFNNRVNRTDPSCEVKINKSVLDVFRIHSNYICFMLGIY
jgi:hypothetical protein